MTISCVAAEGDGVRIYVTENLSIKKVNFANGLVTFAGQIGVLLGSLAIFIFAKHHLSFRAVFFVGALMSAGVMFFRRFFVE
jgi:MFS family permease